MGKITAVMRRQMSASRKKEGRMASKRKSGDETLDRVDALIQEILVDAYGEEHRPGIAEIGLPAKVNEYVFLLILLPL